MDKEIENNFNFFDIKTKVVSSKGVVSFEKINPGDKIFTYNIKTRKIDSGRIKKIFNKDYNGEMIKIKGDLVDQKVNHKHKLLLSFQNGNEEYVDADSISKFLKNRRSSGVSLVNPYPDYFYDHNSGLKVGGLNLNKYIGGDKKDYFPDMEIFDFIYLIANYLKFGSISSFKDSSKEDKLIRKVKFFIGETLHRDQNRLSDILKFNGFKSYFSDNYLYVNDQKLIEIFLLFGDQETRKKIPKFIWKSSDHLLSSLKEVIFNHEEEVQIFSKKLLKDLIFLTNRLGYGCRFKKRSINEEIKEYIFKLIDNRRSRIYKNHVKRKNYVGLVWGVEIEGNQNLLISRNGKVSFCGI